MKYLRWLLFPFSLLYCVAVIIRNWLYDAGFLKVHHFDKPVIAIGNLDIGGAGKSPLTEYLVRLLKKDYKIATLSRGYGRKTKGYLAATATATASATTTTTEIGDEPAQFKHKFPDITVAVCEDRAAGIKRLLPDQDLILLDDAYQHRAVAPGLSILLFDYGRLYKSHLLLPAGSLREPFSGRWRAQIIVITKCPPKFTNDEMERAYQEIKPLPYQSLFFSSIAYQPLVGLNGEKTNITIEKDSTVFLLTGIANTKPLLQYLSGLTPHVIHHNYPDHHPFTLKNIAKLAAEFSACKTQKKLLLTTEKDAQRLERSWFSLLLPESAELPVFVIPIKVEFLAKSGQQFDRLITEYVREHTTHNSLH